MKASRRSYALNYALHRQLRRYAMKIGIQYCKRTDDRRR